MTAKKCLLPFVLAAVIAVPAMPAHAMTWGGDVFGAFSTHTMGDWNDLIDAANSLGANADNINSSFGGGIGLRLMPNSSFMIEGTWEPLFPSTEEKTSGDKIKLTANSFQLTGTYFFPTQMKGKFGLAGGLGLYSLAGKVESAGSPDEDLSGTGVGFHVLGTGEWDVSPGFAMFGAAGYRMAKISDTKLDDQSANPEFETDFSGFTARAGLAFYMIPSGSER